MHSPFMAARTPGIFTEAADAGLLANHGVTIDLGLCDDKRVGLEFLFSSCDQRRVCIDDVVDLSLDGLVRCDEHRFARLKLTVKFFYRCLLHSRNTSVDDTKRPSVIS
jgi:hypothetical protein